MTISYESNCHAIFPRNDNSYGQFSKVVMDQDDNTFAAVMPVLGET